MKQFRLAIVLLLNAALFAGDDAPPPLLDRETINLYATKAPNAVGEGLDDMPAVQVLVPKKDSSGASMVVCPGGGYGGLAPHEGTPVGEWLAQNGITAFVLRYRHAPKYQHPVPLADAQRAIRFVRANAKKWNLDPDRVGILGFSAGGHLAGSTAIFGGDGDGAAADPVERVSSKPTIQVLIYPVITMGPGTHQGSRDNLLGKKPTAEMLDALSLEKKVETGTPQAFLVHSVPDQAVPIGTNTDKYAAAMKTVDIKHEYVRWTSGPHGFGLQEFWTKPCIKWLRGKGF